MNALHRCLRLARTLRHVPLEALRWRLLARAKTLYYRSPLFGLSDIVPEGLPAPRWVGVELFAGDPAQGQALAKGQFGFVGQTLPLDLPPRSWRPAQASALWVFNLHYHEWLADLRAAGQRDVARQLVADWLLVCGSYHPVVWHPYPTSLRLVAWLTHGGWVLEGADEDLKQAFYASVRRQAMYLAANPELDLGGNHYLKNLKALIYAGLALEMPELTTQGMAGLLRQLEVQILPDGMHYELSPMYAAQVLRDLLEVRAVLRNAGGAPKPLEDAVRKLGTALGMLVHNDGALALFNDAAELEPLYVAQLLRQSGADDVPEHLPDAGYARLERGPMALWFDAGRVGPDANPGHAHADMLSLELDVGRERVIVNCGTYAYQHPLRNVFRATAAHSTVSLEGVESAEVWGGFRVGRRPRHVEMLLQGGAQPLPGGDVWVEGRHDGFAHVGATHRRKLLLAGDGSRLRGEDEVTFGKDVRRVRGHFHLHPSVQVRLLSDAEAELETAAGVRLRLKVDGGRLDVKDSRYAPHFGAMRPSRQLVLHGRASQGVCQLHWELVRVE